jgi:hypothetical protein
MNTGTYRRQRVTSGASAERERVARLLQAVNAAYWTAVDAAVGRDPVSYPWRTAAQDLFYRYADAILAPTRRRTRIARTQGRAIFAALREIRAMKRRCERHTQTTASRV